MTKQELEQIHAVQREFLHDAATTLEIDPEDATVHQGDYGLTFSSFHQAKKVAALAAKNYRNQFDDDFINSRTKPPRACHPAVIHYAGNGVCGKYLALMDFEQV